MTILAVGKITQPIENIAIVMNLAVLRIGEGKLISSSVFHFHIEPSIPSEQNVCDEKSQSINQSCAVTWCLSREECLRGDDIGLRRKRKERTQVFQSTCRIYCIRLTRQYRVKVIDVATCFFVKPVKLQPMTDMMTV